MDPNISILDAAVTAAVGYAVVFLGLAILMCLVILLGRIMQKRTPPPETVAPAPTPAPVPAKPVSAGQVDLHGVDDRTAAMLMAIVAHKLDTPVNRLRFISIREIKEEESHAV